MRTREQTVEIASRVLTEHAPMIVRELSKNENFGPGNLIALLQLFADALDAANYPDTVGVIDARMGHGWTLALATALSGAHGD